jgi:[acyl-carrier-protein] S-malonyltransferase
MNNTALVFPGQGSQSVGMMSDFAQHYPAIQHTFTEASDVLGYDVWDLVQTDPDGRLNQTEFTQVAMLTADVAVYRLVMQQGVARPRLMAGHSLGEYAALVCAEAITFGDAVRLVSLRGQVMQKALPVGAGAMAAIVGLTDEQVQQLCTQASSATEVVTPANYNAIGQVVVAGHTAAVERLIELAEKADARLAKIIPVSVPCHCPLLLDASEQFAQHLANTAFKKPAIEVISNVDLSSYASAEHLRQQLARQLYSPVRWVETIQLFKQRDIELVVECGPGKVLGGLVKRIDRSMNAMSVYDADSMKQLVEKETV